MTKTNDFEGIKLFLKKIDVSKKEIKKKSQKDKRALF